ncbi:hypothetical protein AC15_1765 [Escherichia coli 2-156-04_S3_C2]|nr:hypothetical protein AC15_1765 [Escherichia coli 2-156-04_S3_C2]
MNRLHGCSSVKRLTKSKLLSTDAGKTFSGVHLNSKEKSN